MTKDTKQINEEKVCADSLVYHLKQQCGCNSVEIQQETNDPPDFWLTIDSIRFAAEVTSIVTGQGYRANSCNLQQAISASATQGNLLRGRYCLTLRDHPDIPKRNSQQWMQLIDSATSFIGTTYDVAETPDECLLLKDAEGRLAIKKISGNSAAIILTGPVGVKWEGKVEDELCQLMQVAVDKKREKLLKKGVPAQCPRSFLLFYDAYGYGGNEEAQKALLRVKGYDWFHSIYWAPSFSDKLNDLYPEEPGRSGIFLYSRDEAWWRHPTTKSNAIPVRATTI